MVTKFIKYPSTIFLTTYWFLATLLTLEVVEFKIIFIPSVIKSLLLPGNILGYIMGLAGGIKGLFIGQLITLFIFLGLSKILQFTFNGS